MPRENPLRVGEIVSQHLEHVVKPGMTVEFGRALQRGIGNDFCEFEASPFNARQEVGS